MNSFNVLALDIGGANLKAAFLKASTECFQLRAETRFLPLWKLGKEAVLDGLKWVKSEVKGPKELSAVSVTMTAELSDIFFSKREGVGYLLDCVESAFPESPKFVLGSDGALVSPDHARRHPLTVASSNWAATGWLASRFEKDCIVIDVGSTTTSIVPVAEGKVAALGKNDTEKLELGELVYSGALRTNAVSITNRVEIGGKALPCSSEFFSNSGDVHLVLDKISREDYTTETPDGRGNTRREALARLARLVCGDLEILSESEIVEVARFLHERQVAQIGEAIATVKHRHPREDVPALLAGIGRSCIGKPAAERAAFQRIVDLATILGTGAATACPATGLAVMTAQNLAEIS